MYTFLFSFLKQWLPILLLPVLLSGCFQWRASKGEIKRQFRKDYTQPVENFAEFDGVFLRYLTVDHNPKLPSIVFVHGAPGSSKTYFSFLKDSLLATKARLIAVDRLGYGFSEFGESETSLERQAVSLSSILKMYKTDQPLILVGHSFGGPVIARIAADFPELVDGLVFLAPAIDPALEKFFWFTPLGKGGLSRWFTPKALKVATDEKYAHVAELEMLLPLWEKIKANTTYIHGDADYIVPYENTAFIQKSLTNAPLKVVTVPDMNHYLPTQKVDLVTLEILELLERIEREN